MDLLFSSSYLSSEMEHDIPILAVLPDQFFPSATDSPERRLARAVLFRALADLDLTYDSCTKQSLGNEAMRWVTSNDRTYEFSFLNLCDALQIEPHAVRDVILNRHPYATVVQPAT